MPRLATRDFKNSVHLNGTVVQYVAVPNFEPSGGAGATLSAMRWLRAPSGVVSTAAFSKFDFAVTKRAWAITIQDGKMRVFISKDGGSTNWKRYDSPQRIDDNRWHLCGFTWDNGTLKLFIDGAEVVPVKTADVAFTQMHQNDRRVMHGSLLSNNVPVNNWSGLLGAAWLWSDVLTPTEISDLYWDGVVPSDNKQGEWLFSEGTGATVVDTSGNGRTATITGATWKTDVPIKLRTNKTAFGLATARTLANNRTLIT